MYAWLLELKRKYLIFGRSCWNSTLGYSTEFDAQFNGVEHKTVNCIHLLGHAHNVAKDGDRGKRFLGCQMRYISIAIDHACFVIEHTYFIIE